MSDSPLESENEVEKWIEATRAGSPDGMDRIAETYRNYLLLIANQQLDADLQGKFGASDLVQESLVQAHQKFHQFRGQSEAELLGWLRQILQNQLSDAARHYRHSGKRQISRERRIASSDSSHGVKQEIGSNDRSARAEMIAKEEAEELARAMERLPDEYRQVIMLRSWDRLPFAEVGKQMSRSEAAAGKLWSRAIERLQQELETSHER